MPVFDFKLEDFFQLLGKKIPLSQLENSLAAMGVPLEEKSEEIWKVEVFPNRPDMLSVEGLARAMRGFFELETGLSSYSAEASSYEVIVDESVKEVRPYISIAVITNVNFTDESLAALMQHQEKLHTTQCRNRKKGSIGVYNADTIEFPLTYKAVELEEISFIPLQETKKMTPLEILREHPKGQEFSNLVGKSAPILLDAKDVVLSFPPIINSEETKVTEKSTSLIIDVTGTTPRVVSETLNLIVTSLIERGATVSEVIVKYPNEVNGEKEHIYPKFELKTMKITLSYINKRLGTKFTQSEVQKLLAKMKFEIKMKNKEGEVKIPCYRVDIMHPIDFIEDIAIAYGIENFKPTIPKISTVGSEHPLQIFSRRISNFLTGLGSMELMTYYLTSPEYLFDNMKVSRENAAEIDNPKTTRYTICRTWMLPSMIEVLSTNKHAEYPQCIFEIGDVVKIDNKTDSKAKNLTKLVYAQSDAKTSFSSIHCILETLMNYLDLSYSLTEEIHPSFIEGRTGAIHVNTDESSKNKVKIGIIGEIHPEILKNWGLEMPVVAFELDFQQIFELVVKKA